MRHSLDEVALGQGARGYALSVLAEGGPLSRAIAGRPERIGRLYTWAPPGSDADSLDRSVQLGGVLVTSPPAEPGAMVPIVDPASDLMLDFVASYLSRPSSFLIVDDPWLVPADVDGTLTAGIVYGGDHVAHVVGPGWSREAVDGAISEVLTWEWCGTLSRLPGVDVPSVRELTTRTIDLIAANADHLLLSAFDHEGWIVGDLSG